MSPRSIFGRGRALERRIDELLDRVSETAMILEAAIAHDAEDGGADAAVARIEQVLELKRRSSALRREIEAELYTEMLIPDLLGDVTDLIESLHRLVEQMHRGMRIGRYRRMPTPDFLRHDAKELGRALACCVDSLVQGARAFFRDFGRVRDHVHKVSFHESECDAITDRMLEKIYSADLGLAFQDHVAAGVRELDSIADAAEHIADALTIYAIKRAE